jgi:hypothetical protein
LFQQIVAFHGGGKPFLNPEKVIFSGGDLFPGHRGLLFSGFSRPFSAKKPETRKSYRPSRSIPLVYKKKYNLTIPAGAKNKGLTKNYRFRANLTIAKRLQGGYTYRLSRSDKYGGLYQAVK